MKHLLKSRYYSTIISTPKYFNQRLSNSFPLLPTVKLLIIPKLSMADLKLDIFKYAVTYPSAHEGNLRDLHGNSQTPVVLLFGWGGAQDKIVAKYSKIYENEGMITIRYTPPNKYTFLQYNKMKIVGQKLVNLVRDDLNFSKHPILVHCFSNTGSISYLHVSKALVQEPKASLNIKGVIFDSTPGDRRVLQLFRVIKEMARGNSIGTPLAFIITIAIKFWWTLEEIYNLFNPKWTGGYVRIMNYLTMEAFKWPQHCIYSKADDKIDYHDVDNFIQARKKIGVDVTSLCFEDSKHVQHYLKYKDTYIESVLNFANKCLHGKLEKEGTTSKSMDSKM